MVRKVIQIDEEKCNGCGICADACREGAIEVIAGNDIKNITITRMEVPCCGGLERMAIEALRASGKLIPWQVVTFSLDGCILG